MFDSARDSKEDPFKIMKQELIAAELVDQDTGFVDFVELKQWLQKSTILEEGEVERVMKEVFFVFFPLNLLFLYLLYLLFLNNSLT